MLQIHLFYEIIVEKIEKEEKKENYIIDILKYHIHEHSKGYLYSQMVRDNIRSNNIFYPIKSQPNQDKDMDIHIQIQIVFHNTHLWMSIRDMPR